MNDMRKVWVDLKEDWLVLVARGIIPESTTGLMRLILTSPPLRAALLFRLAARGGRGARMARNLLMSLHACDVSAGASLGRGLCLPHPVGIVVGKGVVVRDRVTLYQHVTLGADRSERYPHIESDVVVYPQAVIAGSVIVGSNATVGALAKVTNDVPTGTTVRS